MCAWTFFVLYMSQKRHFPEHTEILQWSDKCHLTSLFMEKSMIRYLTEWGHGSSSEHCFSLFHWYGNRAQESCQCSIKWSEARLEDRSQPFFHMVPWWSSMDLITVAFYRAVCEEHLRLRVSWVMQILENRVLELDSCLEALLLPLPQSWVAT